MLNRTFTALRAQSQRVMPDGPHARPECPRTWPNSVGTARVAPSYLPEVEAQDASLYGTHLVESVLAEAFDYPISVALSADGAYLALGTAGAEVRLWRVANRAPILSVPGHSGGAWAVALSGDARQVASGGLDGTVKL
jgi:WD40 repeat protein